jgi:small subunit ribosomal protein S2
MAAVTIKQLLEAGVHFGHQTRRWNPRMAPYLYGDRNQIHIIDLRKTAVLLEEAHAFVKDAVSKGGSVLFVGTKKQVQAPIAEEAIRAGQPYVNYRWLGGMLTNFRTIQKRIFYMKELIGMEESGEMDALPKKERLRLRRELEKLQRNLGGVANLQKLPSAVFVVDLNQEHIALKEARRLKIPIIGLVDSNCDPTLADFVVPGNDDAVRSAQLVASVIADACIAGTTGVDETEMLADAETGE